MNVQVKVTRILPVYSFVSKRDGNQSNKYSFVGETLDQYPKSICFDVFGDDKWSHMQLMVGNVYNISFDLQSREWNGKWFTNATAFAASVDMPQQQAQQPMQQQAQQPYYQQPAPQQFPPAPTASDVPF